MGDVGQENIEHMWDFEFWKAFINAAATHRYNLISRWNLHPFPLLVKVPEYPDVALDDVVCARGLKVKQYSRNGRDFTVLTI